MNKKLNFNAEDASLGFLSGILFKNIALAVGFAIIFGVAMIFGMDGDALSKTSIAQIFLYIINNVILAFTYFAFCKARKYSPFKAGRIKKEVSFRNVLLSISVGAVAIFGFMKLINIVDKLIARTGYEVKVDFPIPLTNFWWLLLVIFVLAVLPAICEELIFRGVVFQGFLSTGKTKAVLFSALLFTLFHGTIQQTVFQFALGIILAIVVLKTCNIVFAMIIHFVNNCIACIFQYINVQRNLPLTDLKTASITASEVFIALGIAITASLIIWGLIALMKKEKENTKSILIENKNGDVVINEPSPDTLRYIEMQSGKFKAHKFSNFAKILLSISIALFSLFWIVDFISVVFLKSV